MIFSSEISTIVGIYRIMTCVYSIYLKSFKMILLFTLQKSKTVSLLTRKVQLCDFRNICGRFINTSAKNNIADWAVRKENSALLKSEHGYSSNKKVQKRCFFFFFCKGDFDEIFSRNIGLSPLKMTLGLELFSTIFTHYKMHAKGI